MAKNNFFNNFSSVVEQDLINKLIIESISIYGHDVYFLPRNLGKYDEIYNEDQLSFYNSAFDTRMYIKSLDSYEGDGTFLSKFNIEIRDQITFVIARTTFTEEIGTTADLVRPREGDLIYSSMMKRLFIIKYVNNTSVFYQLGALQTWDLVCEVFEYSNERINTGIAEIDNIEVDYSFAGSGANTVSDTDFSTALFDVFEMNTELQSQSNGLIDWTSTDPWSEGNV